MSWRYGLEYFWTMAEIHIFQAKNKCQTQIKNGEFVNGT